MIHCASLLKSHLKYMNIIALDRKYQSKWHSFKKRYSTFIYFTKRFLKIKQIMLSIPIILYIYKYDLRYKYFLGPLYMQSTYRLCVTWASRLVQQLLLEWSWWWRCWGRLQHEGYQSLPRYWNLAQSSPTHTNTHTHIRLAHSTEWQSLIYIQWNSNMGANIYSHALI